MNEPSTSAAVTTPTRLSDIAPSAPTQNVIPVSNSSNPYASVIDAAQNTPPVEPPYSAAAASSAGSDYADDGDLDNSDPENEEFFFESDHLALRGNADYTAVLRTLAILQTQRMQVTRNIDQLASAERRALDDPAAFVRQLKAGTVNMPGAVTVAELPSINFEKYGVSIPDYVPDGEVASGAAYGDEQHAAGGAGGRSAGPSQNSLIVRGRMFDQTKPETFNQLWTCEEQKRLEELLVEYPPEAIEMRRFAKIARALGNRTTKQVASRLQKFFKKLHSAGMPVPGRIPKSNRQYVTKAHRLHKQALRSTTFFPANQVPFHIADEEDDAALAATAGLQLDSNWYRNGCYEAMQSGQRQSLRDDDDNSGGGIGAGGGLANARRTYVVDGGCAEDEANGDENAHILRLAMRIKRDKEREMRMEAGTSEHVGFKCDVCTEEPIIGTRWHCQTCAVDSVDFCSDCLLTQLLQPGSRQHSVTHRFVALRVSLIDSSMDSLQPQQHRQQDRLFAGRLPSDEADDSDDYASVSNGSVAVSRTASVVNGTDVAAGASELVKTEQSFDNGYRFPSTDYNYLDPNFLPQ